ncbi:PilN domain-containing protein [Adhaeretor mobilis]|uniref:Fimbrial assembly family protein n=1 Tax=Adhaeretor mobilis TaxID=1930276 RepID=A0A517MVP5_9BACT|nr:PilN domain-containing protein [Adhaeretor mobilis]QDS98948.1 hypothetical protein HG15A2_22360 [Adhaeretor mobilis]
MNRSVNLMTDAALRDVTIRRHRRVWLVVLPLLVAIVAVPVGMRWKEVRPLANQRVALEQQYEPARQTIVENKKLSSQVNHLLTDERLSILLSEQRPISALLGVVSHAASGEGMQVRVEQFDLQERTPDDTLQTGRRGTLQLRGLAARGEDVSRFVQALRQPPFQSIQLETTEKVKLPSFDLESFSIRCEY